MRILYKKNNVDVSHLPSFPWRLTFSSYTNILQKVSRYQLLWLYFQSDWTTVARLMPAKRLTRRRWKTYSGASVTVHGPRTDRDRGIRYKWCRKSVYGREEKNRKNTRRKNPNGTAREKAQCYTPTRAIYTYTHTHTLPQISTCALCTSVV